MKFEKDMIRGKFLKRLNRFTVLVQIDGREVKVHLANSGRLGDLLVPGHTALLAPVESENRKTKYDLCLIQTESKTWISADARLPNKLFHEALLFTTKYPYGLNRHNVEKKVDSQSGNRYIFKTFYTSRWKNLC